MAKAGSEGVVSYLREMAQRDCSPAFDGPDHHTVALAAAEIERLRLVEQSIKMVMAEVRDWSADAGSTKTPRGRTLNAINQRLGNALKGKQAKISTHNQEGE